MQRLFSTFPDGWTGFGLLLLRLGVGSALISLGIGGFFAASGDPVAVAQDSIEAVGAIFLILGLWTPVAGALIAQEAFRCGGRRSG
jgi:putative oxidoreductase